MSVDGIWYVKLADGDVERLTLDQLDEAFQGGQIDENCMILADGATQWTRLGDLLGTSEGAAPPSALPAPAQPAVTARSPFEAPVSVTTPAATVAKQPVVAPTVMSMRPPAAVAAVSVAGSVRPVTFDLAGQFDVGDVQYPAPSRKRWVVGALGAALVVGAGAFLIVARAAPSAAAPPAPVFVAAAAAQPPPPAPAPQPVAQPQAMNAGPSSIMDPTQPQQRLTDDQKRKLLDAEKSAKSHVKSHAGGGGAGGSYHPKEKSTGFTTDGNKFDPLNSSL